MKEMDYSWRHLRYTAPIIVRIRGVEGTGGEDQPPQPRGHGAHGRRLGCESALRAPRKQPFTGPRKQPFTGPRKQPFTRPRKQPRKQPFTWPRKQPFTCPRKQPRKQPFTWPRKQLVAGPRNQLPALYPAKA